MGYLQNIKSTAAYVKAMNAFLYRMPTVEREEACEEVRHHLDALVEDFQAGGHSQEKATQLAASRFGYPFAVGIAIAQRWEVKQNGKASATKIKLAQAWIKGGSIQSSTGLLAPWVLFSLPHLALLVVTQSVILGCFMGYVVDLEERLTVNQESEWEAAKRGLQENKTRIAEMLSEPQSMGGRILLRFLKWSGERAINRKGKPLYLSVASWDAKSALWGGAILTALFLWAPDGRYALLAREGLIALTVSVQIQGVCCWLMNHLLRRRLPAQM